MSHKSASVPSGKKTEREKKRKYLPWATIIWVGNEGNAVRTLSWCRFWRRLSRFMSKINPEPNLIHIMGCYVLGNPNGEKVRGSTLRLEGFHLWSVLTVKRLECPFWDHDARHPRRCSFLHLTECNDLCSPGMNFKHGRSHDFLLPSLSLDPMSSVWSRCANAAWCNASVSRMWRVWH